MSKVTLKPGDYVRTEEMTEEQYHAVAKAFLDAGALEGEYPNTRWALEDKKLTLFGWRKCGRKLFHGTSDGQLLGEGSRQLTIEQVLGTQDNNDWIEWRGGECPVEHGALVDVRYRDGMQLLGVKAGIHACQEGYPRSAFCWGSFSENTAIIAYRLHQTEQEEAPTIDQLLAKANKHAAKAAKHEAKREALVEQARELFKGMLDESARRAKM